MLRAGHVLHVAWPMWGGRHGWTPAQLPGIVAWFRFDQLVTLASGDISALGDISGHGNNLAQGNSGIRPTWNASDALFAGKPSATFDPASFDRLQATSNPITGATARTLLTVSVGAVASPGNICRLGWTTGPVAIFEHTTSIVYSDGTHTQTATGLPTWTNPQKVVAQTAGQANQGLTRFRVGGTDLSLGSGTGFTAEDGSAAGTWSMSDTVSSWYNGRIAEWILCTGTLSLADIQKWEAYVTSFFGV